MVNPSVAGEQDFELPLLTPSCTSTFAGRILAGVVTLFLETTP
jgi:hypothetical protein